MAFHSIIMDLFNHMAVKAPHMSITVRGALVDLSPHARTAAAASSARSRAWRVAACITGGSPSVAASRASPRAAEISSRSV